MDKVSDKSFVISQLKLVKDVKEHIKGYLFYDKQQILQIDKIKKLESQRLFDEISNHWSLNIRAC